MKGVRVKGVRMGSESSVIMQSCACTSHVHNTNQGWVGLGQ